MWPQTLQMTRDECRGILRRLELETYSHVISAFRAQGGLSDNKAKLLEQLRDLFHISQERHRAEARRVANDEQLSTIAEAISGPNTWQEWSREGRRSFPMLPRVAPQTALALIANNVASEAAAENFKLPYPAETAAAVAEDQVAEAARDAAAWETTKREGYVVTDDPFKMPEIPAGPKKNLKRNLSENRTSGSSKKRLVNDASPTKQQQQQQKQYAHITANSATNAASPAVGGCNIRKLYHNHSNNKLQQQRYFHHQQIQKQKLAAKKSTAATAAAGAGGGAATGGKRQTPVKSSRKAQTKAQEQKHQQQQMLQQQQQQQSHQYQQQQQQQLAESRKELQSLEMLPEDQLQSQPQHVMPQIAASKKDITKNLTKLQLPVSASSGATGSSLTTVSTRLEPNTLTTSPIMCGALASVHGKMDKQLISTPVQKFILEDRQPPPQPVQLQVTSTPQIMTLPQISAAATKLRAVNTTILPPGTKLTPKKMSVTSNSSGMLGEQQLSIGGAGGGMVTSQSQVYNIMEGTSLTTSAQTPLSAPTHTPPAIIQLQSSSVSGGDGLPPQQPTQGKVLTTKLLPIVLSGSAGTGAAAGSSSGVVTSTANITKIETLNNGATLVTAGGGVGAGSTSIGTAIIKNMPSTLVLSPNQSSSGGTIFSTLASGASVFRKPPIIKTGTIGMGPSNTVGKISSNFNVSTSNSGPQIISSVKLTPAISTTNAATTHTHHQQQQQFLQHQLKNVPTTGIRTSVKICQSPNGKVFIQPANVDATKVKLQGGLQHKLLPNSLVGATSSTTTATPPQRIAIQKVQIIPAPLNSPGHHLPGTFQSQQQPHQSKTATTTLTIGNKGNMNMIFMPAAGGRTTSGTITLAKGNIAGGVVGNIVAKVQPQQQQHQMHMHQQSQMQDVAKPTNVVVIGATSGTLPHAQSLSPTATSLKSPTYSTDGSSKILSASASSNTSMQLDHNQMITEDTPVDILNMPIIVDGSDGTNVSSVGNNMVDTVTVLSSALVENATQQAQSHQQPAQHSTIILGATDWEMELDQATAVAAASKARTQYRRQSSSNSSGGNKQRKTMSEQQQLELQDKPPDEGDTIIIDDSFDDVIVEEQEEDGDDEVTEVTEEQTAYGLGSGNDDGEQENHRKTLEVEEKQDSQSSQGQAYSEAIDEDDRIEVIDDEEEPKQTSKRLQAGSDKGANAEANIVSTFGPVVINAATTVNTVASIAGGECENDAGFDETIVTEIDENTAIEYIEDDNNVTLPLAETDKQMDCKRSVPAAKTNDLFNSVAEASKVKTFTQLDKNNCTVTISDGTTAASNTTSLTMSVANTTTTGAVGKELLAAAAISADLDAAEAAAAANEVDNTQALTNQATQNAPLAVGNSASAEQ